MRKFLLVFGVMCVIGAVPLFAQDAETGEAEKEPIWKGSLGLSWVATTGNTDTSSFGLDFGLDRKPDPWGLSFVVRGNRADDSGVKTADSAEPIASTAQWIDSERRVKGLLAARCSAAKP